MKNTYDIDFETRSRVDIKLGGHAQAHHPDSSITVICVSKNKARPVAWDMFGVSPECSEALALYREAMTEPNAIVWAHNASFETAWACGSDECVSQRQFGFKSADYTRWRCSQALCRILGTPISLEDAASHLGGRLKASVGTALIKVFCEPTATGAFREPRVYVPAYRDEQFTPTQPVVPADIQRRAANGEDVGNDLYRLLELQKGAPPTKARLASLIKTVLARVSKVAEDASSVRVAGRDLTYVAAWKEFIEYCRSDVEAQIDIRTKLAWVDDEMPQFMRASFHANLEMNARGAPINIAAVHTACDILDAHSKDVVAAFKIETAALLKTRDPVEVKRKSPKRSPEGEGLSPSQRDKCLDLFKSLGYPHDNLQSATTEEFLDAGVGGDTLLRLLRNYTLVSYAATKKLFTLAKAAPDGRVRGCTTWCGAGTGRDSSVIVQLQNLKRPDGKIDSEKVYEFICAGYSYDDFVSLKHDYPFLANPHEAIASAVRHFIQHPEHKMISLDFANVEARLAAWLTGQDDRLARYAADDDIYCVNAAYLLKLTYEEVYARYKAGDKEIKMWRQVGKVMELACGFRGGREAVRRFAKDYRVTLTEDQMQEIVTVFRREAPMYPKCWAGLEEAAIAAVTSPGTKHTYLRLSFQCDTRNGMKVLRMILPSGRSLYYPQPRVTWVWRRMANGKPSGSRELPRTDYSIEEINAMKRLKDEDQAIVGAERAAARAAGRDYMPSIYYFVKPSLSYWGKRGVEKVWCRVHTHGGVFLENATQASAGDFLHLAIPALTKAGMVIDMPIHDEVIGAALPGLDVNTLEEVMAPQHAWADGFPLKAKGTISNFYTKD